MILSTIIYFIILVLSYITHIKGKEFYNNRVKNGKTTQKVYDISHKYLPNLSHNNLAWAIMHIFATITPFIFGTEVITDMAIFMPVIFIIRGICSNVTILPKDKTCDDSKFGFNNLFLGHCYDKIFSGHFATTIMLSLILFTRNILGIIPLFLFNLINAFLILATRSHYTIDLIVSIFVVVTLYSIKNF